MNYKILEIKRKGDSGEAKAEKILISKGYEILERNYHSGREEIDIIAQKYDEIIFVEVKTRQKNSLQSPAEAVTLSKQKKIIKAAERYMYEKNPNLFPRFDVIEIYSEPNGQLSEEYNHIQNAFWKE